MPQVIYIIILHATDIKSETGTMKPEWIKTVPHPQNVLPRILP